MSCYVPTGVVVVISWVSFFLEDRWMSARMALGINAFMALSFQFGATTEHLPRVSYVKCIDIWLMACIIFIFLSLAELCLCSFVALKHQQENRKFMKLLAQGKLLSDGKSTVRPIKIWTSSQIDAIARWAFPTLFAAFNACYWVYYLWLY